jgi:hypothetical protein
MRAFLRRFFTCVGLSLLLSNPFASAAAPQTGWWWNANEAGRGFFIEVVGDWMFVSGYFYGEDGRPTWLVSNDPMPDPRVYQGRLLSFHGGQSLVGDYRAPTGPAIPGNIRIEFADDSHATMTWPGGVVALERQPFQHATSSTFAPRAGWWWNPDESGRGFSVELQGDHMFVGAYMYDDDGAPVWYVADALMKTATRFEAPLLRFANGQTLTGGYRHPDGPSVAGSIIIDFSDANTAMVTLADLAGTKGLRHFPIEPQKQYSDPPQFLDGSFTQHIVFTQETADIHIHGTITWKQSEVVPIPYDGSTSYVIQVASITSTLTGSIDRGDVICDVSGKEDRELSRNDGSIDVARGGYYKGSIHFMGIIHAQPCGMNFNLQFPVVIPLEGVMEDGGRNMRAAPFTSGDDPSITTSWEFFGRE